MIEDLPQRHRDHGGWFFPLAGRRRPGKRASASGESSLAWLQPLTASHRITGSCPQGCDLLPDQRPVPLSKRGSRSGKNIVPSVLSVSLWLVIIDYLANSLRIETLIVLYKRGAEAYLQEIH